MTPTANIRRFPVATSFLSTQVSLKGISVCHIRSEGRDVDDRKQGSPYGDG
jgi:hypothetical protein